VARLHPKQWSDEVVSVLVLVSMLLLLFLAMSLIAHSAH
jgi:hypothetical protein